MNQSAERLQKRLAAAGLGSRREVERWIRAGRVVVNGSPAELGQRISDSDRVEVDGRPVVLAAPPRTRVLAYHKPVGEVCTRADPDGRPTVFDNLPPLTSGRWLNIGRLDINTVGLLLFTNDGELLNRLTHPSQRVVREYAVRVLGAVDEQVLERLRNGVELDDGPARFEKIVPMRGSGANRWFRVRLREGRNREVRRLWEAVGCTVNRLIRVRFGAVQLERDLLPGQYRELDLGELGLE